MKTKTRLRLFIRVFSVIICFYFVYRQFFWKRSSRFTFEEPLRFLNVHDLNVVQQQPEQTIQQIETNIQTNIQTNMRMEPISQIPISVPPIPIPIQSSYERGCEFMRGDRPDGRAAYELLFESIERERNPEAVLMIAELYRTGVHNSVNPDKVTACRIYQTIQDYASKFPRHITATARQRYTETMDMMMRGGADNDIVRGATSLSPDFPFELARILTRFEDISVPVRWQRNENRDIRQNLVNDLHGHAVVHHVVETLAGGIHDFEVVHDDDPRLQEILFPAQRPVGVQPANIQDIARVQVRVNNDNQNVHSSTVLNCAKEVMDATTTTNLVTFEKACDLIVAACAKTQCELLKIQRVLSSMTNEVHSRFQKSEKEILCQIVSKIQSDPNKDNLMEILVHQLDSAVERTGVVCSTGRIVRILSVFDGVDDKVQKIIPEWALDQELANLAFKVRNDVLQSASEDERNQYETAASNDLANKMHTEFERECKKLYSKLVKSEVLNQKIAVYKEGF